MLTNEEREAKLLEFFLEKENESKLHVKKYISWPNLQPLIGTELCFTVEYLYDLKRRYPDDYLDRIGKLFAKLFYEKLELGEL